MKRADLLTLFLYGLDIVMTHPMRTLARGEPTWLRRPGARQHLNRLSNGKLVERLEGKGGSAEWAYRLTELGRLAAIGGRDPAVRWQRKWDGEWRMLLFDLPSRERGLRQKFWRWLRENHFGCLQRSAWVSPDPIDEVVEHLDEYREEVGSLCIVGAKPYQPKRKQDQMIAAQAWDHDAINRRYRDYVAFVEQGLPGESTVESWARHETGLWLAAVQSDPLLPADLLPKGYLGRKAWSLKRRALKKIAIP